MLSEPKRKTVWSLNPRGKYWSEDKTKIGQKLLESMGWREGLGLGKHNNGLKDNIKINSNSDNKGLGYKPSLDNVWVDKNDDYEQLLANLAVHHNNGSVEHKVRVSNLEETSKKLRNRLHYSKLIKAKNLSKYSEKDLISIIPKKHRNCEKQTKSGEQTNEDSKQVLKSDNTFESTTNINDYFKSKMDKLKIKFELNQIDSTKVVNNSDNIETSNEDNCGSLEDNTSEKECKAEESAETSDNSNSDSINPKKNKKQKKNKRIKEEIDDQMLDIVINSNDSSDNQSIDSNFIENKTKKEKSKRKRKETPNEETNCLSPTNTPKKSNKRCKLNPETLISVPKGYNSNTMSVTESLKNYHKICAAIEKDKALSTTNLMTLKGYGCHSL